MKKKKKKKKKKTGSRHLFDDVKLLQGFFLTSIEEFGLIKLKILKHIKVVFIIFSHETK